MRLRFLLSVGVLFTDFGSLFQKQEPFIHLLYTESTALLRNVEGRFLKTEFVTSMKGSELIKIDSRDSEIC